MYLSTVKSLILDTLPLVFHPRSRLGCRVPPIPCRHRRDNLWVDWLSHSAARLWPYYDPRHVFTHHHRIGAIALGPPRLRCRPSPWSSRNTWASGQRNPTTTSCYSSQTQCNESTDRGSKV